MTTLTGKQRLRQIRVKNRIISARELRAYLAGSILWLPCSGDREAEMICTEFDRVYALGVADGRRSLGSGEMQEP